MLLIIHVNIPAQLPWDIVRNDRQDFVGEYHYFMFSSALTFSDLFEMSFVAAHVSTVCSRNLNPNFCDFFHFIDFLFFARCARHLGKLCRFYQTPYWGDLDKSIGKASLRQMQRIFSFQFSFFILFSNLLSSRPGSLLRKYYFHFFRGCCKT